MKRFERIGHNGAPIHRRLAMVLVAGGLVSGAGIAAGSASAGSPGAASRASFAVPCQAVVHIAASVKFPNASWKSCFSGTITQSSPTVLSFRGRTIVAVGDENGVVHLVDAATGKELPGWPERVSTPPGKRAAIESNPTFAYLDGPHRPPSLVVSTGSTWVPGSVGEVEAFDFNGNTRFVFHVGSATGTSVGVVSSPAVGNLTGSGQQDIVFGSWDHELYALNPAGQLVPGFPINNADTIWSSPALFHEQGQHGMDIFYGSDASGRLGCFGGFLTDLRYSNGGPRQVWSHCFNQVIWSSPVVGVLTNPNQPVVVVGTGWNEQPFPSDTDRIYAFDARTGTALPGWPVKTAGPTYSSPAIGVLAGTSTPSVVDVSWNCSGSREASCFANGSVVAAWSASGQPLWSAKLPGPTALGSPVLVPLVGESANDVMVSTPNALYPLSGESGALLFGTNATNQYASINGGCRSFATPAVADVFQGGNDLGWRVFESCGGPPAFKAPGELAAYPLPTAPPNGAGWPMFHGNAEHTGVATATF